MGKSEMERKGNFGPSYLSFPVPFRPFQINPAFLSLSEKNGQLSGKGNIVFLSLTCMEERYDRTALRTLIKTGLHTGTKAGTTGTV